ncbi:hypothetical protein ACQKWADRAFT_284111 [Trichoderma austrokoningii]
MAAFTRRRLLQRLPFNRAMSFNPPNQLWNSQFGVRFGALASLRQEESSTAATAATTSVSQSLHTSTTSTSFSVQSNASWSQTSVSSAQTGVFSSVSFSDGIRQPPIAFPGFNIAADATDGVQRPPISLPGLDVAAVSSGTGTKTETVVEPPFTPLEFSISREQFLAARAAVLGTPESHWSYSMYHRHGENGAVDDVQVHYCEDTAAMERVCAEYFLGEDVIGLDLEWMQWARAAQGPRYNVSLIQIASPSHIALFHIAMFEDGTDLAPPSFRKIMKDVKVSKVGVNIGPDCTRLKNHLGVTVQGIFELSHLYRVVKYFPHERHLIHRRLVALAVQVQDQLLLPLYKGDVRVSDWTKRLSPRQREYSASDAYAGLQLFYVLEEKRKMLVPCPPRPHHAELQLPIPLPDLPGETNKKLFEAAAVAADSGKTNAISKPKSPRSRISKPKASSAATASTEVISTEVTSTSTGISLAEALAKKARSPRKARSRRSLSKPIPVDTRDARVIAAEVQMKEYRAAKTTGLKTTEPCLRAYYIWHRNEDLCVGDIAALLRDPPLLTSTVAHYVLDAIKGENLPYPVLRLNKDVLPHIDLTRSYWIKHTSLVRECKKLAAEMERDVEKANETHE